MNKATWSDYTDTLNKEITVAKVTQVIYDQYGDEVDSNRLMFRRTLTLGELIKEVGLASNEVNDSDLGKDHIMYAFKSTPDFRNGFEMIFIYFDTADMAGDVSELLESIGL